MNFQPCNLSFAETSRCSGFRRIVARVDARDVMRIALIDVVVITEGLH